MTSIALFGPLIAPPEAARTAIRARAAKARGEGAAGMHEIALGLLNAAISADTRQRSPLAVAFVRESLMRQDPDGYARTCDALAEASAAAVERIEAPVLLVTGDEDGVAPPQAVRALAEKLHSAQEHARRRAAALRPLDADRAARGVRARAARLPRRATLTGAESAMADIHYTNVRIFDGGGEAPFMGEVLVQGDRISRVVTQRPAACAPRRSAARRSSTAPAHS